MKGTFFQKPLEFRLNVNGEAWSQGDRVSGELTIKNHSSQELALSRVHLDLAHGKFKKIRSKALDAFSVIASAPVFSGALGAGTEVSMPFEFTLDANCPITDSLGSLFLVCGAGQLQLNVLPAPVIQEILRTLEVHFRFVSKGLKASDGVEAKFVPPAGRSFITVEELLLSFHLDPKATLSIEFNFHVKQIDAQPGPSSLKIAKKTFELTIESKEYLSASGRWNRELLEQKLHQIIDQVEAKIVF